MGKPVIDWDCFAWHIRDALNESKASLRDFERLTGVDHATLQRASQGKPVKAEYFLAICDVLDADPRYWFTDAEGVTVQDKAMQ